MAELSNPESLNQETLYDPGIILITKHEGYPCAIDCSPFHRNIFLSATTSGHVIVQNLLEVRLHKNNIFRGILYIIQTVQYCMHFQPHSPMVALFVDLKTIGTLNDAKWSGRPAMFAVAHENLVKIYDLKTGTVPALTISHDQIVSKIAFNKIEYVIFEDYAFMDYSVFL